MSKRNRQRKKALQKGQQQNKITGAMLANQGLTAFNAGDYNNAIKQWEIAQQKDDTPPNLPQALAEAYFRRALNQFNHHNQLSDLETCTTLQPHDNLYNYHLGLAYHRNKQINEAEAIYRSLLAEDTPFLRAAMPLAQLLVDRKKSVTKDPVWKLLTADEKQQITVAYALVTKKAKSTLQKLANNVKGLAPIWYGLLSYRLSNYETAQTAFQAVSSNNPTKILGVANYYQGNILAQANDVEAAFQHWERAKTNGITNKDLPINLSRYYAYKGVIAYKKGNIDQTLTWFDQINRWGLVNISNLNLNEKIKYEAGYQAARRGDWHHALNHWQSAILPNKKPSRQMTFNLALAYEKTDHYWHAAEKWRELLRRRPRKANHPEALTDDQVARIWQHVAENYSRDGNYEEAIKTYKNAVKWAPDNLDLRLKLVEAYQTEGRWQAGENELNRILKKDPDNIRALTLLAESYEGGWWGYHRAKKLWQRILELEPQNPIARQQLAQLYIEQGSLNLNFGDTESGLEILKEGLTYIPDSQQLNMVIGAVYLNVDDQEQGRHYLNKALAIAPNDLNILLNLYVLWLKQEAEPELAIVVEKIKALPASTPHSFFIQLIEQTINQKAFKKAEALITFCEARYVDNEEMLIELAQLYAELLDLGQKAVPLLKQVLNKNPENALANLRLGTLYYKMEQTRLGKRYWKKAEDLAKKNNDQMVLYELRKIQDYLIHGKQQPSTTFELLQDLPPEVLSELLKDAPPEVAEMLKNMGPEALLQMMMGYENFDEGGGEFYV